LGLIISPGGRVGRLGFFLISVGLALTVAFVGLLFIPAERAGFPTEDLAYYFLGPLLTWIELCAIIKRLRDLGHGWVWVFLTFVPLVNGIFGLYLLFMPGVRRETFYPEVRLPRRRI
jgi:uncharacterized membrane protein YhaH (DUF805 family)